MSQEQTPTPRDYRLLFLRALTPLHVGAGRGASVHVELPFQRDEFGFPTIWSSSLKGTLRANFIGDASMKKCIFGPEPATEEVSEYSSATSFTDARLLLIPARVLKGVWAYVTSPHMLQQLNTLLRVSGRSTIPVPSVGNGGALVSKNDMLVGDSKIMVNEITFEAKVDVNLVNTLKTVLPKNLREVLDSKGVIMVSDNIARTIVNKSLIIQYRIRLDPKTKTVVTGGLWSEEYLPSETLMISLVVCRDCRFKQKCTGEICKEEEKTVKANEMCDMLVEGYKRLNNMIYVGGKETLGKGLIELYFT